MPRPLFTPRKDALPIVQEAGRASGPVWTGAENLKNYDTAFFLTVFSILKFTHSFPPVHYQMQ